MIEKLVKLDREALRLDRSVLQAAQYLRDEKAKRRAVITLDEGSTDSGTVENVISASEDFTLPGKLIVDWAEGCEIGGRCEKGTFIKA